MSILRTIAMFIYLFGYMILHYGILRRAERAAEIRVFADEELCAQLLLQRLHNAPVPREIPPPWSRS